MNKIAEYACENKTYYIVNISVKINIDTQMVKIRKAMSDYISHIYPKSIFRLYLLSKLYNSRLFYICNTHK